MSLNAIVTPSSIVDGESLHVTVTGLNLYASTEATVVFAAATKLDTSWAASVSGTISQSGVLDVGWTGVSLGREAAVFVTSIQVGAMQFVLGDSAVDGSSTVIVNPAVEIWDADHAETRRETIRMQREAIYKTALGKENQPGVLEHRAVVCIEELLVTSNLRVPGAIICPVNARPNGGNQRQLVDEILGGLAWPTRIESAWWTQIVQSRRPWTAILFPKIWAIDIETAAAIAQEVREDLISVLGLNRGSRGRPIATVIEQRQHNDVCDSRVYLEGQSYGGNLIGGQFSGESQSWLLLQYCAIRADPLLRLLVNLYSEALREESVDAQYFRFWSILETLSGARVPTGQKVVLLDGTQWPDPNVTTQQAAPRVYEYLAVHLVTGGNMAEQSVGGPATSLYDAVRAWYGRRNATGHYGRFVPGDPFQQKQGWSQWASKTLIEPANGFGWLRSLRETVALALDGELGRVSSQMDV